MRRAGAVSNESIGSLADLLKAVATGSPLEIALAVLEAGLKLAGRGGDGRDSEAKVRQLVAALPGGAAAAGLTGSQLHAAEVSAAGLLELVARELRALDRVQDDAAELAREVLLSGAGPGDDLGLGGSWAAAELAAVVSRHLESDRVEAVVELRSRLQGWVAERLGPVLAGDDAQRIGGTLAENLIAALLVDPTFQARASHQFRERCDDLLHRVYARVCRLDERSTLIEGFLAHLSLATGVPSPEQLDELIKYNRPLMRRESFVELRHHLCRPLQDDWIYRHLKDQELDPTPEGEQIPDFFCYLPHVLKLRRADAKDRDEGSGEDDAIELDDLLKLLTGAPGERRVVLVEALAGFGKTTFLSWLSWALAQAPGGPLPIVPISVVREGLGRPLELEALIDRAVAKLQVPSEWPVSEQLRRNAVRALIETGRALVLVDGLDQVSRGPQDLLASLDRCDRPVRVVATCREELSASEDVRWTHVVQLREPTEDCFRDRVSQSVQDLLVGAVGRDTSRHPFFIHVGRLLCIDERNRPRESTPSDLLGRYLEKLYDLARLRSDGASSVESLSKAELLVLGVLGLTSLRVRQEDGGAAMQLIDSAGLDRVRQEAAALLAAEGEPPASAEPVLTAARSDAHVLYARALVEPVVFGEDRVFLFHHQLVQEYLAALGLRVELQAVCQNAPPAAAPRLMLERLTELVQEIVQPSDPITGVPGDELPDRVPSLKLWRFLAELLADRRSQVRVPARAALVREITQALWSYEVAGRPLSGPCASALLRIRDELLDCDSALVDWVRRMKAPALSRELAGDPVWAQCGDRPDPFMILCWQDERQEMARQLQDLLAERSEASLLPVEDGKPWEVFERSDAHLLARDHRGWEWSLVPPGPFLAGSGEYQREMPLRTGAVDRAFWIARLPVTVADYQGFVGDGYRLDDPWWRDVREAAEEVFREGQRSGPWSWSGQRVHSGRPVVGVSWFEAIAFCWWLGGGGRPTPRCPYRLPTEQEWEKAARGLWGRRWPWGSSWVDDLAVTGENHRNVRNASENRNISPWCLPGVAGNAWEWCGSGWERDGFGEELLQRKRIREIKIKDTIVTRGGAFCDDRYDVRCAFRDRDNARYGFDDLGFRCVRDVPL